MTKPKDLSVWVERRRDVGFNPDAGEYGGAIVDDIKPNGEFGDHLLLVVPRSDVDVEYEIIKHVSQHDIHGANHLISEYEVKVISCLWVGCGIVHSVINAEEICWEIDND